MTPGEIHLWCGAVAEAPPPDRLERLRALLSAAELQRSARFLFDKDRALFLFSHALVRLALSAHAPRAPGEWQFTAAPRGKPVIANPPPGTPLHFNLSHTRGFAACAIAPEPDIGVDVENTERRTVWRKIARHSLAPAEIAYLESLPEDRGQERFFQFWTLKEAYAKARGRGLSIGFPKICFRLEEPEARLENPAGDSDSWRFFQFQPAPRHPMALCVRRHPGREWKVVLHDAADLLGPA